METTLKILAGAVGGAVFGLLAGKVGPCCSSDACSSDERPSRSRSIVKIIFSMLSGAIFGAAAVWYFISK